MEPNTLTLIAPLSGHTLNLEQVPDPVFATKTVGDGVAIDPTSDRLLAPCSGEIAHINPYCHALIIKATCGVEILIHIGIDTVNLKSEGFTLKAKAGDKIEVGQELIEFNADLIADKARSLITMILVTNPDQVTSLEPTLGRVQAGKDAILTLGLPTAPALEPTATSTEGSANELLSDLITIPNPQGLHARPAALLAKLAKRYQSQLELESEGRTANCRSVVGIMAMQVAHGQVVRLRATGSDADAALQSLSEAITLGLGEDITASAQPAAKPAKLEIPAHTAEPDEPGIIKGVGASTGIAVGKICQLRRPEYQVKEQGGYTTQERRTLDRAIEQAKNELEFIETSMRAKADPNKAGIFAAHRELLDDPDLIEIANAGIATGKSAGFAWKQAYLAQVERLSGLNNDLLAARATDIKDVGERVLRLIMGERPRMVDIPAETILVAEDLTPSDTATLDRSKVLGFATVLGGSTSHVAILARSLDLPAIAGVSPRALEIPDGTTAVLDGEKGTLRIAPSPEEMAAARESLVRQTERQRMLLSKSHQPATTTDGHSVEVVANVGSIADTEQATAMGAEGVGLLRSEFLFIGRTSPPTEEEQFKIYAEIAKALGPEMPLIIRTLDVGGDKPLPYLPIPKEDNPFLGQRGIRVSLAREDLLRTQFRAIIRASSFTQVKVMLPMVTTIDEYRRAKVLFNTELDSLGVEKVPLGVMIEVPAAAIMCETLAQEADFFSIGTNDLTQYTLAIDRGHPKLAAMADGLNPAVLRLIEMTAQGGHRHHRMVGICGGIAGDILAVPILVGLGVDELSVAAPAVPAVKERIRTLSFQECKNIAMSALKCESAGQVRELCKYMSQSTKNSAKA